LLTANGWFVASSAPKSPTVKSFTLTTYQSGVPSRDAS
jgi:hypothetical protein